MGGCVSSSKDIDAAAKAAPAEAPLTVEKPESEAAAQENDGGEEAPKKETDESKPADLPAETEAEEPNPEAPTAPAATATALAEPAKAGATETAAAATPNEAQNSGDKSDAPLVSV